MMNYSLINSGVCSKMGTNFELNKLKEILINFYNLTHMRFVIFDERFEKILAYPDGSCDFCAAMKNTSAKSICKKNDKEACEICKKNNDLYIYICHAGLVEVVAPIKMNDIVIGYIMFGQVCKKDGDKAKIFEYSKQYITDEQLLSRYVKKIAAKSEKQIKATADIMNMCTSYIRIEELIKMDTENIIVHLTNYINSNIRTNLNVNHLCAFLGISRCKLYEISHKYYGMSIAKYIKKKKVALAVEYLTDNNCTISEAADYAGFYDYNYFSKVFKSEMGVTPSEYKKNLVNRTI